MTKEYILCAAIWYKKLPTMNFLPINITEGLVICGHRHGHCINSVKILSNLRTVTFAEDATGEHQQGFLTNTNRFVDRTEAGLIAFKANQTINLIKTLYSEDLY